MQTSGYGSLEVPRLTTCVFLCGIRASPFLLLNAIRSSCIFLGRIRSLPFLLFEETCSSSVFSGGVPSSSLFLSNGTRSSPSFLGGVLSLPVLTETEFGLRQYFLLSFFVHWPCLKVGIVYHLCFYDEIRLSPVIFNVEFRILLLIFCGDFLIPCSCIEEIRIQYFFLSDQNRLLFVLFSDDDSPPLSLLTFDGYWLSPFFLRLYFYF